MSTSATDIRSVPHPIWTTGVPVSDPPRSGCAGRTRDGGERPAATAVAQLQADPVARHSWLSDLKHGSADVAAVADAHRVISQALDGDVVPNVPWSVRRGRSVGASVRRTRPGTPAPPDGSAVAGQIAVTVRVDVQPAHRPRAGHRTSQHRRPHGVSLPLHSMCHPHTHCQQASHNHSEILCPRSRRHTGHSRTIAPPTSGSGKTLRNESVKGIRLAAGRGGTSVLRHNWGNSQRQGEGTTRWVRLTRLLRHEPGASGAEEVSQCDGIDEVGHRPGYAERCVPERVGGHRIDADIGVRLAEVGVTG